MCFSYNFQNYTRWLPFIRPISHVGNLRLWDISDFPGRTQPVSVCFLWLPSESHNLGDLKPQKCICPQCRRPEVLNQGLVTSGGFKGETTACLSSCFCWSPAILALLWLVAHHPDLCLQPHTASSLVFLCPLLYLYGHLSLDLSPILNPGWFHLQTLNIYTCKDSFQIGSQSEFLVAHKFWKGAIQPSTLSNGNRRWTRSLWVQSHSGRGHLVVVMPHLFTSPLASQLPTEFPSMFLISLLQAGSKSLLTSA